MEFTSDVDRKVIPGGWWQRFVGIALDAVGIFAIVTATRSDGSAVFGTICLSVGSTLIFWGLMLRYFSTLEEKLLFLAEGAPAADDGAISE